MRRASEELIQERISELRKQLIADDKFLKFLEPDHFDPEALKAEHQKSQPRRTPAQDLFAGESLVARKNKLAKNAFRLPELSAGIATKKVQQRIGIICDEFLYKSFVGLADFVPITPENYRDVGDIDVLLLASTWRGIDGVSWQGVTRRDGELQTLLLHTIVPYFRGQDVPIVFYSKEDPPNFIHFLPFAKVSDVIFTSAEEMIPRYQEECPQAESIGVLPFGVNPLHHSPLGHRSGTQDVIPFAGSWFNHKYAPRGKWGRQILRGVVNSSRHDLLIFDRNSDLDRDRYYFPVEFLGAVMPSIGHDELLSLLRLSDIAINLNSVQDSRTMYANRVVELQATGTLVLSNYNAGINSRYPQVHTANSARDVQDLLENLKLGELRRIQADGIRDVFTHDLTSYRIDDILRSVGLQGPERHLRVAVTSSDIDDQLRTDFAAQTYGNLEVISENDFAARAAEFDIRLDASTDFAYGPHYVQDIVNGFHYSAASSVQKVVGTVESTDKLSHQYRRDIDGTGSSATYLGVPQIEEPQSCYVLDNFEIQTRGVDKVVLQPAIDRPAFSVIVPIYNNGRHLEHKCFASLRRSSMFEQMEVIFVDDGSTDPLTHEVIDRLAAQYRNVKVYKFPAGGSGSASRPRNKGLELVTADYVTYLDPDNEALNDGFAALWQELQETGADFALGNMSRWRSGHRVSRYVGILRSRLKALSERIIRLQPRSIVDLGFQPMSIQALMANTEWLTSLGIEQPVGAVGQDSFFFQQMFYYATSIATVGKTIHTYYGEVADSVVNTVSARFFEKYRPLEAARAAWLREIGLLEEYKEARLENFLGGWYLAKLPQVMASEVAAAEQTILDLTDYYGGFAWSDPVIIEFMQRKGKITETEAAALMKQAEQNER
ncbi:glycosyltransferase [Micrococcoides hystricis]|uniref:Glycosyltransferase n=1 Tax=Micrococcoides hystricis TaxID=1572761 RepID=A0ABV6PC51_9MICC